MEKGNKILTAVKITCICDKTNQLLSEKKPYSLNSTYNFCALKNLQLDSKEKFDPEPGFENRTPRLVIWRPEIRIPIEVQIFLLKSKL